MTSLKCPDPHNSSAQARVHLGLSRFLFVLFVLFVYLDILIFVILMILHLMIRLVKFQHTLRPGKGRKYLGDLSAHESRIRISASNAF
jgi:hypothetical protein